MPTLIKKVLACSTGCTCCVPTGVCGTITANPIICPGRGNNFQSCIYLDMSSAQCPSLNLRRVLLTPAPSDPCVGGWTGTATIPNALWPGGGGGNCAPPAGNIVFHLAPCYLGCVYPAGAPYGCLFLTAFTTQPDFNGNAIMALEIGASGMTHNNCLVTCNVAIPNFNYCTTWSSIQCGNGVDQPFVAQGTGIWDGHNQGCCPGSGDLACTTPDPNCQCPCEGSVAGCGGMGQPPCWRPANRISGCPSCITDVSITVYEVYGLNYNYGVQV